MRVVQLTEKGVSRILEGVVGMTFVVHATTRYNDGRQVVHVRDYRFKGSTLPFQIWSIGPDGYTEVKE